MIRTGTGTGAGATATATATAAARVTATARPRATATARPRATATARPRAAATATARATATATATARATARATAAALAIAALALAACGGASAGGHGATAGRQNLTVFAAASLQPPFDRIAKQLDGMAIRFDYAGTQTLTSQLMQGAQADVFASADTAHMETVQAAGLVDSTPRVFAHNRLEIAVEKGNPKGIHALSDLSRPGVVVVLADPSVPAGKYAQQALSAAGVKVRPASLETQVSGVLSKVALGEADAGIVYVSDIVTSGQVDGVVIPDRFNVVADYPIARLKGAPDGSAADSFVSFLLSDKGQAILSAAGFERA